MSIIEVLRNINDAISNKIVSKQVLSFDSQFSYLNTLPEPINDIERSYNQYLCQVFSGESKKSLFLKNIASKIMLPYYLRKKYKPIAKKSGVDKSIVYIYVNEKKDMLPDEIKNNPLLITIPYGEDFYLGAEEKRIVKEVKNLYPSQAYFVYKVLLKLGLYSAVIKKYNPQEIVVNAETSFTSSILTDYCEKRGVKHTDVMHGEKVFWIRDSFFRFSNCYVWSEYHRDLFISMRAIKSNYIISLPAPMKLDSSKIEIDEKSYVDYKFYLGLETQQTIEKLKKIVCYLKKKNRSVMLRPHPVYTDMAVLRKSFDESEIENVRLVSIEKSIISSRNVVSIFSTVLRQAVYAGIRVVVDNCSNEAKYNEMKNLKFWLYEQPHQLLSEELKSIS